MTQAGQPDVIGFDDGSFEEFVAAASGRLFTMARLLTGGNRPEAEDLLQGAFERAYRHWGRISRRGDPERYVRQILVNASADRWRWLRRHPEAPLSAEPPGQARADQSTAVADRDLLLRALAALPPRQRAVLVLRYFEDLTEAQTAAVMGCTVGTVKSQAARALARLREGTEFAAGQRSAAGRAAGQEEGQAGHDRH
jgi:RNA polymerase sigma-70 factor (sigma-E family)